MGFRPLDRREAVWRTWEGSGLQRVVLWREGSGILAEGALVVAGAEGCGASFRLECDGDWRVRSADVRVAGGSRLGLRSDGAGRWSDGVGVHLPELDGCIDIDLQASPLTNILPIRRIELSPGDMREFRMAYIPFPSLKPFVDEQRYTCIAPGRLYRYEAADGSFTAELRVDEDGLVEDYPGLFRRLR